MAAGHDIAMSLRLAYLAMHRQTEAHLAALGVTADQFVLLGILAQQDGLTQQELAQRASSDPNTVRAMLVLLEGAGLIARRRHPTDGRARSVALTARGRRVYQKLWARSEPVRARLLAGFRPEEVAALLGFLGRIARVMAPPEGRSARPRRPSRPAGAGSHETGSPPDDPGGHSVER